MKLMCRLYISKHDQQDQHPQIRGPHLRVVQNSSAVFEIRMQQGSSRINSEFRTENILPLHLLSLA